MKEVLHSGAFPLVASAEQACLIGHGASAFTFLIKPRIIAVMPLDGEFEPTDQDEIIDLDDEGPSAWTREQLDAISQAIQPYLKPDINWDSELAELTRTMGDICARAQVLGAGDNQRYWDATQTVLQGLIADYDHLPEGRQFHIERQVSDHFPSLDGETAPTVPGILRALLAVLQQAAQRPFDAPYADEQDRGPTKNYTMVRLVTHLLWVFDRVTGKEPTFYARSRLNSRTFAQVGQEDDARTEYRGRAHPFLLACLLSLNLVPRKTLPSAMLTAYQQAKRDMRFAKKAWAEQLHALDKLGKDSKKS